MAKNNVGYNNVIPDSFLLSFYKNSRICDKNKSKVKGASDCDY